MSGYGCSLELSSLEIELFEKNSVTVLKFETNLDLGLGSYNFDYITGIKTVNDISDANLTPNRIAKQRN